VTYWEQIVMGQIFDHGPRFAGSGTGALSDAGWSLVRQGLLAVDYDAGLPYLTFTPEGVRKWRAFTSAQQTSHPPQQ
jgi:hypothetical protein